MSYQISYTPLFVALARRNLTINALKDAGIISQATQAKLRKSERINLDSVAKICVYLGVPIEEVVEVVPEP